VIQNTRYLGGLPNDNDRYRGNFCITDDEVGAGVGAPEAGVVGWNDIAGISFDPDTVDKSRVGKAVAFGVLALAAKRTQNVTLIMVALKSGGAAFYQIQDSVGSVRALFQPYMTERGVPCLDDPVVPIAPVASVADEIAKLGELKAAGLLTEDEFVTQKAKLLS
jgi:hypothetical protein